MTKKKFILIEFLILILCIIFTYFFSDKITEPNYIVEQKIIAIDNFTKSQIRKNRIVEITNFEIEKVCVEENLKCEMLNNKNKLEFIVTSNGGIGWDKKVANMIIRLIKRAYFLENENYRSCKEISNLMTKNFEKIKNEILNSKLIHDDNLIKQITKDQNLYQKKFRCESFEVLPEIHNRIILTTKEDSIFKKLTHFIAIFLFLNIITIYFLQFINLNKKLSS